MVVLLALARPLAAQDDRWQVTLDGNRYVWDIRLVGLEGDALAVRQSDSLARVPSPTSPRSGSSRNPR